MNVRHSPDAPVVAPTHSNLAVAGPTFHELLFEWMERAPWLVISLAAHVVVLLVLSLVPWRLFEDVEERPIFATLEQPPEVIVDDPPEEPEPVIEPDEVIEEPVIVDAAVVVEPSLVDASDDGSTEGEQDQHDSSPFNFSDQSNNLLGVGGGSGNGPYGDRFRGDGPRRGGPHGPGPNIAEALQWLVLHQDADGKWDADEFMKHDVSGAASSGPGHAEHDIGVTALALLALLGDGHTTQRGEYRDHVARGVRWLTQQQDPDSGLIGERIGHSYLYGHGIATLALCEAYYFSSSPLLKPKAQAAVSFVTRARNPYGVWRYEAPPNGDQDTSVTGWMVLALKSAQEAGLEIDSSAFADSLSWLDEVTDPATGRTGYAAVGERSSRIPGMNDHYPVDSTESMTSVALLCRAFLGQSPDDTPAMQKGAALLRSALPEHDADGLTNDLYYWYYGSYAMYQLGGRDWKVWSRALDSALVQTQRKDGNERGSWDPDGPWGMVGGRVYSTALGVLCCEAYYRYSRVLGGR
jgi:hypothetical protein